MPAQADIAIVNATVYTPNSIGPQPEAVATIGNRIVALGSEQVKENVGPRTRIIDAGQGLVVPGFQDSHIHAPFAGRNRLRVWLNGLDGREAYLGCIARYAAENPNEPWIVGGGWAMEHFPNGCPSKEDLDAVVPDRPVFLFNRDVHSAWVNSKALAAGGITKDSIDPLDGRIERDLLTGEPSGTLHEGAAYSFNDGVVPLPTRAEWESSILEAQKHLHALGITGWQDAWVTPGTLDAYRSLGESGQLTARVVGALWWDRHRGLDQVPDLLAQRESGAAPNFFPTTVKLMTDGMIENRTGALLEPYCDGCGGHTDNHGLSFIDQDLLVEAVRVLDSEGFQLHMHAIGDRAIRNALDAIESAQTINGPNDHRHHLAHVQLVAPEDIPRFKRLDVIANCQPYWAQSEVQMDELTIPWIGRDRAERQYPFGSLMRAGAPMAMGSDWSVSTANPLEEIEVAVTRVDTRNRSNAPFLPEERIPLRVALDGFTSGSAYVNHDEAAGVIASGRRADLAVLDRNLFNGSNDPIGDARVTHTIAGGSVVFEAD